ncbi:hypothetical protein [Undibacterium rugosum]|uniref:Secreted protein n=1 Tax=Undibacterium rugosum TaxID=2762291 RepID=A0A923I1W4_9BURK|nr:hypothetical protein [Undibacterium rugosum]MBC3933881.1 hypothetical protein [Undibacterium rugosum]MBR7777593.1 hypothetical protein [Undibacterium rugosum]
MIPYFFKSCLTSSAFFARIGSAFFNGSASILFVFTEDAADADVLDCSGFTALAGTAADGLVTEAGAAATLATGALALADADTAAGF